LIDMSKKRFIQAVIVRLAPKGDAIGQAIEYAEGLWTELDKRGYGDTLKGTSDKPSKPRKGKDWYAALSDRQRKFFDLFWDAFNYKFGRNEAAERWGQLGAATDEQFMQIIAAAKHEAKIERVPGQARKYAQGWLFEKRSQDYQPKGKQRRRLIWP
jgi:hypothetical protein